jgi:hypothetical protein
MKTKLVFALAALVASFCVTSTSAEAGLFGRLMGGHDACCGCDDGCGCEVAPAPCCEPAPAPCCDAAPACGCEDPCAPRCGWVPGARIRGLLDRVRACGCRDFSCCGDPCFPCCDMPTPCSPRPRLFGRLFGGGCGGCDTGCDMGCDSGCGGCGM